MAVPEKDFEMTARTYAAKLAARLLLKEVWKGHGPRVQEITARQLMLAAPELIAKKILGFRVEKSPAIPGGPEIAGFLDRHSRTIAVSTRFSFPSQRFTFAHELGHAFLHT